MDNNGWVPLREMPVGTVLKGLVSSRVFMVIGTKLWDEVTLEVLYDKHECKPRKCPTCGAETTDNEIVRGGGSQWVALGGTDVRGALYREMPPDEYDAVLAEIRKDADGRVLLHD